MRISTPIAISVAILLGVTADIRAVHSPAATRSYDVSGRVIDEATGKPIPKIRLGWSALEIGGKGVSIRIGAPLVDEQGAFRLPNLAPGRYAVYVPINSGSEYYSDEVVFEVIDQDVTELEIKARRAASLSGVVVIEGALDPSAMSDLSHLRVSVGRLAGGLGTGAQVSADGRFRVPGLPPDKFRLNLHSRTQRQRYSLLGIERDDVRLPDWIEVTAGEQVSGLRLIVAYGEGVVRRQVQVVGGTLPEGARLSVSARRANLPGWPSSASGVTVDARGRFLLEGLATGVYEISLMVFVPSPAGGTHLSPLRPPVRQTISVTSGAESQAMIVLDLNASSVKKEKR